MLYDTTSLIFLSTLSLRRATIMFTGILAHDSNFYPRSPCGERPPSMIRQPTPTGFLSTLSLRRATISHFIPSNGTLHFYPRSPCGERPLGAGSARGMRSNFYPRSPCGERRRGAANCYLDNIISIHALLAESDLVAPVLEAGGS